MGLLDLPDDVIVRIGNHLSYKDRRQCYMACKGLKSISWGYDFHTFKVCPENYHTKITHMKEIVAAVRRFKKHLRTIQIRTYIDNTHVDGLPPFDPDIFEGVKVDIEINWEHTGFGSLVGVDKVMDLFQNIKSEDIADYMLFVNHDYGIDVELYKRLRGDKTSVHVRRKDPTVNLDMSVVPAHVSSVILDLSTPQPNRVLLVRGADHIDQLYCSSDGHCVVKTLEHSFLQLEALPRLKDIAFIPALQFAYPLEDNCVYFKLLNKCPAIESIRIILHDNLAHQPDVVSYVRSLASKFEQVRCVSYYTRDTMILATIIQRFTGVPAMKLKYSPYDDDELARALSVAPPGDLANMFESARARAAWWFLGTDKAH